MKEAQRLRASIINFIRSRNTGTIGEYTMCEGGEVTLYSSCFAAMTCHYLNALSQFSDEDRKKWSEYINDCQDKETGLYIGPEVLKEELTSSIHSYEHITMHLTAHTLPSLSLLDAFPRYPLSFAHRFVDKTELLRWLEARDWKNAWLEGNNLLFIGQFLIYLRDYEGVKGASKSLDVYFDWLRSQVDPNTGLWGSNGWCSAFEAMCGGYHQLLVYYYENREIEYPENIVGTVLRLQQPDGGFNPMGGGGACEDADAADILVNMYKQIDYCRPRSRIVLRKLLRSTLDKQMADGGFVYKIGEPFVHMGIPRTRSPTNVSNMFATWFRVNTLALIGEVLTNEPIGQLDWQFNDTCSMGWHRKWDKSRHRLGWRDSIEELMAYLGQDVRAIITTCYQNVSKMNRTMKRWLA